MGTSGKHSVGSTRAIGSRIYAWVIAVIVIVLVVVVVGWILPHEGGSGTEHATEPAASSIGSSSATDPEPSVKPSAQQDNRSSQTERTASDTPSDGDASVDFDSVPETPAGNSAQ